MLNIQLVGDRQLIARFESMSGRVHQALLVKITDLARQLQNLVKRKLSGDVLNVVSGKLRASIEKEITDSPSEIRAIVYSGRAVKYAAIHEFGGKIHHPGGTAFIIDPKSGQNIFISNAVAAGKNYPRTRPHEINMPERSFLRSSLADMKEAISQGMAEAVRDALRVK